SCYALSFEKNTPLRDDLDRGVVAETGEALQRAMYEQAIAMTREAGMQHYEISNFAIPEHLCRHNLTYWRNLPYVGIGPAATTYLNNVRSTNSPNLQAYLTAIEADDTPASECEHLTGRPAMAETLMLALRMTQGVDIQDFTQRFGLSPLDAFPQSLRRYRDIGAVIVTETHIRLAKSSLFVSDTILADILAER
ncbi:MAG: coproporphyrinogen III oxidase, partial [Planctomycetes bacterium]|nr:coproporphyrinogen III oxidase [Planctomycetota bacterium]